ncbi:MAG: YbaN family protein [Candidatus Oceanisphaera merdipullorum]|nr:YbaN family protein [Candidatus Oceanisphaera merdipullorum]
MRILFALLGSLALLLGIIGVFLPVMPTTPFVLLAAFFFSKSSPRIHAWLVNHPWFGPLIQDWQTHRGVRAHIRRRALYMMAISFCFSMYVIPLWQVRVGFGLGFLVVVIWFMRLPVIDGPSKIALK